MTPQGFIQLSLSMRFTRYPKGEAYQITPRKLAAAQRAVQREKDRYPLFPELLKHQTAEDRLTSKRPGGSRCATATPTCGGKPAKA